MALIACHECGAKVSSAAKVCPGCGVKPKKPTSVTTWIIGGVVLSVILYNIATAPPEPEAKIKTPAEIAQEAAEEKQFQTVVGMLQGLKSVMKDPASFELVSAMLTPAGTLCVTYTATNSFNARTTGIYALTRTTASDSAEDWNTLCSVPGKDYRHARHAL